MIRKSSQVHSDLWVTRFEGRVERESSIASASERGRRRRRKGVGRGLVEPEPSAFREHECFTKVFRHQRGELRCRLSGNSLSNKWLPFLQRTSLFRVLSYFARWKSIKSPSAMNTWLLRLIEVERRILMEYRETKIPFSGFVSFERLNEKILDLYYSIGNNSWLLIFLILVSLLENNYRITKTFIWSWFNSFANSKYIRIFV